MAVGMRGLCSWVLRRGDEGLARVAQAMFGLLGER